MGKLSNSKKKIGDFLIDTPIVIPIVAGVLAVLSLVNATILNPSQSMKAYLKEAYKTGISIKVKEILKEIEKIEEDGKVYEVVDVLGEDGKVYRAIENRSKTFERGKDGDLFVYSYANKNKDIINIIKENKKNSIGGFVREEMLRFD